MEYYKELELTPEATEEDIKRAYRKLALRYHPDKNHEPGAAERFKNISEAYQILSDPEKRKAYDRQGYDPSFGSANDENETTSYNNKSDRGHFRTTRTAMFRHDPIFTSFQFRTPEELFNQFFQGQDPFKLFADDPFFNHDGFLRSGGGFRAPSSMLHDPLFSALNSSTMPTTTAHLNGSFGHHMRTTYDFQQPIRNTRSVSTTTTIINGHKQTITKIVDHNGTKVIEDYGDGRQRITINGVEESSHGQEQQQLLTAPSQQQRQQRQHQHQAQQVVGSNLSSTDIASYQMPSTTNYKSQTSIDMDRQYGENHNVLDEELPDGRRKKESPFRRLLSRLCFCF